MGDDMAVQHDMYAQSYTGNTEEGGVPIPDETIKITVGTSVVVQEEDGSYAEYSAVMTVELEPNIHDPLFNWGDSVMTLVSSMFAQLFAELSATWGELIQSYKMDRLESQGKALDEGEAQVRELKKSAKMEMWSGIVSSGFSFMSGVTSFKVASMDFDGGAPPTAVGRTSITYAQFWNASGSALGNLGGSILGGIAGDASAQAQSHANWVTFHTESGNIYSQSESTLLSIWQGFIEALGQMRSSERIPG